MDNQKLQWHPAFQAAMEIEFWDEKDYLQFFPEYNLTKKPLAIDTLIIKMAPGRTIKKNLGQLFRQHNIVEYKSPDDYLSINDFYKVIGYICLYQSDTEKVMEISPDELTMTMVTNHYPREMMKHLRNRYQVKITKAFPGIYYVTGLLFPTQIIINHSLSKDDNLWLNSLREDLTVQDDIEPLIRAYKGKEKSPLYSALMDLVIRANKQQYEEEWKMCDALRELFADELIEREAKGIAEGESKKLIQMTCKKLLKGKTPETISGDLEEDISVISEICDIAKHFAPDYDCDAIYQELQKLHKSE
ncbi:MAG: hypothetical protein Q4C66_00250 [Lachnospiraceae bacterium]|nr:hypothetical protein [Lachnospiraceae bacterium]